MTFYSNEEKSNAVSFYEKHGKAKTLEEYGHIPYSTIFGWVKKKKAGATTRKSLYSTEFKKEVVKMYNDKGRQAVAENYPDLSLTTVWGWANPERKKVSAEKTYRASKSNNQTYHKVEIPEPKKESVVKEEKAKSKIVVFYSDDPEAIANVLKGLK